MPWNGRKASSAWPLAPCLLAAQIVFGEHPAAAEEPPALAVRITESLHAGCPERPSMRERIEAHLGHLKEAGPDEAAIELVFAVERRGAMSQGTLTLSLSGVSMDRKASSKSCADVVAALSMMAAVALGEEAERRPPRAPAEKAPLEAASPPPDRETAARGAPTPARAHVARTPPPLQAHRPALSFGTGFEIEANHHAVLSPSWFAQLALPTSRAPTLRVGLARTLGVSARSARGEATLRWTELVVMACGDLTRAEPLRLGLCLSSELGRLEATKIDPLPARRLDYFWPAVGLAGKISWRAAPGFSIDVTFGARAPLIARELFFEPDRNAVVYRAPAIVPFLGVGFVAPLW